jgi:hypothetical protein
MIVSTYKTRNFIVGWWYAIRPTVFMHEFTSTSDVLSQAAHIFSMCKLTSPTLSVAGMYTRYVLSFNGNHSLSLGGSHSLSVSQWQS